MGKGRWKPGESGNPAGRPPGKTSELRIRISEFLSGRLTVKELGVMIDSLEPKDKIQAMLKLLEFALPKLRSVENTMDLDNMSIAEINELYNRIAATRKQNIDLDRLSLEDRETWYELMDKALIE